MKKSVYSIYDEKAQVYLTPFFFVHDGQALRAFQQVSTDPQTEISRYPSDYKLYKLGQFDDNSGVMSSCQPVIFLANASDYFNQSVSQEVTETIPQGV